MFDIPLPGLSAHNLAAHLTLLGVMKILEEDCPDWRARGYWKKHGIKWTPNLALAVKKTEEDICGALAQGLCNRANSYLEALKCLPVEKLTQTPPSAFAATVRRLFHDNPTGMEFICALSAGVEKNKGGIIAFSPLLLLEKKNDMTGNRGLRWWNEKDNTGKIQQTLFTAGNWTRKDDILKFYWDYQEWVEQARVGRDTENEPQEVEWAACALAQVGFSGLGAFIAGDLQTKAPGVIDKTKLSFPLWVEPAIYDSIGELLLAAMFVDRNKEFVARNKKQLERIGVKQIVEMKILKGDKGRKGTRCGRFLW